MPAELPARHGAGRLIDLLKALGKRRSFRAGQTLEIRVSAAGYRTEVIRFVLRRGQRPRHVYGDRAIGPAVVTSRRRSAGTYLVVQGNCAAGSVVRDVGEGRLALG